MEKNTHVDLVVIGAGPGGYAAAFRAADLGKEVLLVEKDETLGGVCLNRGCIPSKALLHISKAISETKDLSTAGVSFDKVKIDIQKVKKYKDRIVSQLNKGISSLANARKVSVLKGQAKFKSNTELTIRVGKEAKKVTFEKCIIASGSTAATIPGLPKNNDKILTSRTALELKYLPKRLLVIGGGVIGLELGQVYSSLGSEVSVVEYLPGLIPGADPDMVKPLQKKLESQFKTIKVSTKVTKVESNSDGGFTVSLEGQEKTETKKFDSVLISVGRKPNTDLLNLSATDIDINEKGFIIVDVYQRTKVKNIFAIGDITGNPMLAHKATHEGKVAAEVSCGVSSAMDARVIPSVVYTNPEVAWVGLTEKEAKEKGVKYEKGEFPWAASGKAIILNAEQGKTKVLFDPESKKILGAAIVGPSAGDLISEACLAIEMGADAEDVGLTVHPHPTLGETFAAAAEVYTKTITDLYIPSKGVK